MNLIENQISFFVTFSSFFVLILEIPSVELPCNLNDFVKFYCEQGFLMGFAKFARIL